MLSSKLKQMGVTKEQEEMIIELIIKNPELFQRIGKKIETKTKKQGMNQQAAMMQVFREHQDELKDIMGPMQQMMGGNIKGGAPRPPQNF